MIPNDPDFGAGFDAEEFRSAIRNAMIMGMPSNPMEQVTFRWRHRQTFETQDNTSNPYDWTDTPITDDSDEFPDVTLPVACEFVSRASLSAGTPLGEIDTPKVILTLLDDEYEQVKGASFVIIAGATYEINYTAPPMGLFDVSVYEMYCTAQDEN